MSRKNTFDDVVFLAAKLPWWLGAGCHAVLPAAALVFSAAVRSISGSVWKKSEKEVDER